MRYLRTLTLIILFLSTSSFAASLFHSYITDLSPPYMCKLKLKGAKGVALNTQHAYQFSGICSIKLPVGNTWIYQNVWVDTQANWNGETNEGFETTTLYNNMGTVVVQVKCDDDPWLTKSQCALIGYQNNTQFSNLGGSYNARTGQYPPFETFNGQYPPLARNQALLEEAKILSLLAAKQEANAAHTAFAQAFSSNRNYTPAVFNNNTRNPITQLFKNPMAGKLRVDVCLKLNKECGKPAADRFCQAMGFRYASRCTIDNVPTVPTFLIGAQKICNEKFCKGFSEIECVK